MSVRRPDMSPRKTPMAMQAAEVRRKNFDEVALGYTEEEARAEAERCMDCPDRFCADGCPAHTYIPEFISAIRGGDYDLAYDLIERTNPMPGVSSRVCSCARQCESRCARGIRGEPVAIGSLERFVVDWHDSHAPARAHGSKGRSNGYTAAVVGSGPAGLTCALSLAKCGFSVTLLEKERRLGGAAAWGIPSFVLPQDQLRSVLDALKSSGVKVKTGVELGQDCTVGSLRAEYDVVFLATGASKPVLPEADGLELTGVLPVRDFLLSGKKLTGKKVLVLGGGIAAVTASRTAVRLGASSVRLCCRRPEEELTVAPEELALAKEEGVEVLGLLSPAAFLGEKGALTRVSFLRMELCAPDYPGGRKNIRPAGGEAVLDADLAVCALGYANVPLGGVRLDGQGRVAVDKNYETSVPGVYAGGNAITGPTTLMAAAASGKDAAAAIFSRFS